MAALERILQQKLESLRLWGTDASRGPLPEHHEAARALVQEEADALRLALRALSESAPAATKAEKE